MVDTFAYNTLHGVPAIDNAVLADSEFGFSELPQEELPSLESILQEKESDVYHFEDLNYVHTEEGLSDDGTLSVTSEVLPPPPKFSLSDLMKTKKPSLHGSVLRHVILRKMSSQMNDACERREAGLPTCLAVSNIVAIGTSHGICLVFEAKHQILKLVLGTKHDGDRYGAATALGINGECTRLICGYARGQVTMWDLDNGNCLRIITDAHPEGFAVLHLQFTDDPSIALLNDSSGSVYTLSFKRLITRTCESSCFFSGRKGEVCVTAPLCNTSNLRGTRLQNASLLAMASLTKLIVVSMTSKPIAVFTQKISGPQECLPLLNWYFTLVEPKGGEKFIAPVLAFGFNQKVLMYRVEMKGEEFKFICCNKFKFEYILIAMAWLNSKVIVTIDTLERLRTIDILSGEELECLDLSSVQLVYGSSYIKSLPNNGEVSDALRLAFEYACYQSVHFYNGQLLLLGTRSIHCLTIRNWKDRLDFFVRRNEYMEALRLARLFYLGEAKAVIGLVGDEKHRRAKVSMSIIDILLSFLDTSMVIHFPKTNDETILSPYYQHLVKVSIDNCLLIDDIETLFSDVYERFSETPIAKREFLNALENVIINDKLTFLSPVLMQDLVEHFETAERLENLQSCIVHLDLSSIDIDHMVKLCWTHQLFDLIIYVYNKGLSDYITPFDRLLSLLRESYSNTNGNLSDALATLGYKLLVYLSCCLAGNQYPIGKINTDIVNTVKQSVFDFVMVKYTNQSKSSEIYPNITMLLMFDTLELLNVLSLAFEEKEFKTKSLEEGSRRQQVVDILLYVMLNKEVFSSVQVGYLFTFIARQMAKYDNSIHVSHLLFEQVLEHLANPDEQKRHGEREQALLELLNAGGLDYFEDDRILQLAEEAKFYRVCEIIYKKDRQYYNVLSCYWRDVARKNQVYVYIDSIILSESCTDLDKEEMLSAILSAMDHLVEINGMKFAHLIITHFPAAFNNVAGKLQNQPEIQYTFLKGVFDMKSEVKFEKYKFNINPVIHEKFIELMCIYEPEALCAYLQSNDNYRLQEVFEIVNEKQLIQASAYLLERMGDVHGAFKLLHDDLQLRVDSVNESFVDICECELNDDLKNTVKMCRRALQTVMQMCQRNSMRLESEDRESLWFSLLETMMMPQRRIKNTASHQFLIFKELTKDVLINMMEFISLPAVLHKIMQDSAYSSGKFSEIKDLIFGMIDTYNYELTLLETTKNLLDMDLLGHYSQEKTIASRGYRPNINRCYLCSRNFDLGKIASSQEFILFRCRHAYHRECLQGAAGFDEELTCLQCDKSSIIRTAGYSRSLSRQKRGKSKLRKANENVEQYQGHLSEQQEESLRRLWNSDDDAYRSSGILSADHRQKLSLFTSRNSFF